jgi:hypothetical protein
MNLSTNPSVWESSRVPQWKRELYLHDSLDLFSVINSGMRNKIPYQKNQKQNKTKYQRSYATSLEYIYNIMQGFVSELSTQKNANMPRKSET